MEEITNKLSEFFFDLKLDWLNVEVINKTKLFIADYYAACLAGYRINKSFNEANLRYFREMQGVKQATVFLEAVKLPMENAAFMNALYAHGADMDDGNRNAAGHIGTSVISAVFSLAEGICAKGIYTNWGDIFLAVNAGYEAFNRIAASVQPGLYLKGFHATGIAGGIAAGVACAKLLGLNKQEIYNTISLAALQSSGLLIIDESGQQCKPINPANAAKNGLFSALLSSQGVEGPRNPLESEKGWLHTFSDQIEEKVIFKNLGTTFTICESYQKLYPTCRHTHSCIDAAVRAYSKMSEVKESIKNICNIEVYIYRNAIRSAGKIKYPKNAEEAKFSIHYAVGVVLSTGKFELDDLFPERAVPEVWELTNKIELIEADYLENREKGIRGAELRIFFQNGNVIKETVRVPRGEGNYGLTWDEMADKMFMSSKGVILAEKAKRLIEKCKQIEMDDRFNSIQYFLE